MKKLAYFFIMFSILVFSACEYEIIDSKPGEPLDPVSNLNYSISGSEVTLTWDLPTSYPDDIIQPVSVFIRIIINGVNAGTQTLEGAPESYTFTGYDPQDTYKFIVKVRGEVDTDNPNLSDLRYSLGSTIEF